MNSPVLSPQVGPVLSWRFPAEIIGVALLALAPIAWWCGATNPEALGDFSGAVHAPWIAQLAGVTAAMLFFLPVAWMLISRRVDLLALVLAQNSLLIAGYFFLDITAFKLDWEGPSILRAAPFVVVINAAGFAVLFLAMGATYGLAVVTRARLRPLRAPPGAYDVRVLPLLRGIGLAAGMVIALPMAVTGTIPMLAADPVQARFDMISSDAARPLYHLGTALLPFVVGGLLTVILRRPRRVLGFDGWLACGIVFLQILTSNRLPLAITLLVTIALFSLERRWPRWLIMVGFAAYLLLFTGLSGFTSILRQDRAVLGDTNVVVASLNEAFVGDNLIDLRDGAWVFSHWNGVPLLGTTYLGGLVSMVPSGIFPQKKQWHLGLTAIRMVGWDPEKHFGLRLTFFGESFLNFGWAGTVGLAIIMGCLFGTLLRTLHLAGAKQPPCLAKNLQIVILMQMCIPLSNTGDAFTFWGICLLLGLFWLAVDLPCRRERPAVVPEFGRLPPARRGEVHS